MDKSFKLLLVLILPFFAYVCSGTLRVYANSFDTSQNSLSTGSQGVTNSAYSNNEQIKKPYSTSSDVNANSVPYRQKSSTSASVNTNTYQLPQSITLAPSDTSIIGKNSIRVPEEGDQEKQENEEYFPGSSYTTDDIARHYNSRKEENVSFIYDPGTYR